MYENGSMGTHTLTSSCNLLTSSSAAFSSAAAGEAVVLVTFDPGDLLG